MRKIHILLILTLVVSCSEKIPESVHFNIGEMEICWDDQNPVLFDSSEEFHNDKHQQVSTEIERYLPSNRSSVISLLNNSEPGELIRADDSVEILSDLLEYTKQCHGAFDPTLQILWDVYEFDQGGRWVEETELQNALDWVDYRMIEIDGNSILRRGDHTRLGFGPTLPGLLIDIVSKSLVGQGAEGGRIRSGHFSYIIDGDYTFEFNYPLDPGPDETGSRNMGYLKLMPGDYVGSMDDSEGIFLAHGQSIHMILSPVDGKPVREVRASVVISRESCLQASVFAYAVMVMGPERGIEFLDETEGIEGVILTEDHEVIVSGGLDERFWR